MQRLLDTAATLRRVAALVSPGASASETFSAVAREAAQFLGADVTGVFRCEPDGTAVVVGWWGVPGMDVPVGARLTVTGEGLAVSVLRHGQPAHTDRFEGPAGSVAARFQQLGVRSGAGAPIRLDGRLWGVVIAASSQPGRLPSGSEECVAGLTELAAIVIADTQARADLNRDRRRAGRAAAGGDARGAVGGAGRGLLDGRH